jgi:hypothetical protein
LLKSLVQSPWDAVFTNSFKTMESACIRAVADADVATLLGDLEEGMSIDEIADKTNVDALKLGNFKT